MNEPSAAERLRIERRELARSKGGRLGFIALGHVCLGLGVVGAFLPVLPTTVFLIAAAWCYARGSTRLHQRLLANRTFGPVLRDWEIHRAMSRRTKAVAIGMIVLAFGLTIAFAIHATWAKLAYVLMAAGLIVLVLRVRTREFGRSDGRTVGRSEN